MNPTPIIVTAITAASTIASAGIVDMKFTGTSAGSVVQIQVGENNAFNAFAGQLNHEISNAQGLDAYLNGQHKTFCADINEHVSSSFRQFQTAELENVPLTTSGVTPMSTIQANAIRGLYSQTAAQLINTTISNAYATAMQLTIWELVNDFDGTADSINLTAGHVTFAGRNGADLGQDILTQIDAFKTMIALGFTEQQTSSNTVLGLANAGAQDQLIVVPAPGAMPLLAVGSLIAVRRRRHA